MLKLSVTMLVSLLLLSCPLSAQERSTARVTIEPVEPDGFILHLEGEPFYVQGAGYGAHMEDLAPAGGNAIRTWGEENLGAILDEAEQNGLMVVAGLWVPHERHGFSYNDTERVSATLERFRSVVERYRNHPALLMWCVGNEYNIDWKNEKVWLFVNEVSVMIHETDPDHPVMTVLSCDGKFLQDVDTLVRLVPEVDVLGINSYGGLTYFLDLLRDSAWKGRPVMVTEWGTRGFWQVRQTSWGAPLELSSGARVYFQETVYDEILKDRNCLGSFVFFWGWKQERTHTWFNLYLPDGRPLETRESMSFLWRREYPYNRSVQVESLDSVEFGMDEVILAVGAETGFIVTAADPERDPLRYEWELFRESTATSIGGDREQRPPLVTDMIVPDPDGVPPGDTVTVRALRPGAYRLFVYVTDGNGIWGTANIPFLVQ